MHGALAALLLGAPSSAVLSARTGRGPLAAVGRGIRGSFRFLLDVLT